MTKTRDSSAPDVTFWQPRHAFHLWHRRPTSFKMAVLLIQLPSSTSRLSSSTKLLGPALLLLLPLNLLGPLAVAEELEMADPLAQELLRLGGHAGRDLLLQPGGGGLALWLGDCGFPCRVLGGRRLLLGLECSLRHFFVFCCGGLWWRDEMGWMVF
ncbi:hypothetical protein BR93DRAFT_228752 [Coniochaeta sp. PMI_546]|nr:hypothetical protein BR93DRAFT_228752 [Coniochaeta sp. PMI_546]